MKILILANSSSGLYGFRRELISELLIDNEVIAITPDSGNCDDLKKIGCEVVILPIDRRGVNPITDSKLLWDYYKKTKTIKPDIVITYTIKPNIYGGVICRLLKIPYAINITGLGTAFQKEGFFKKLIIGMYKLACKNAKVVFFENSANREVFIDNKIVLSSQTCLLNGAGVNLEHFKVMEYPKGDVTKFLFIGRVMREKGIDELLSAMKMLIDEGVKTELHILGGYEEDYKDILEDCEKEGWLFYHGYQGDVRPFIKDTHCFVLPSWHEGMANTNLECAASGRPLITSNIPGCKEAVVENVSGLLCAPKDAKSLYTALKKFICLKCEDRIKMGYEGNLHMKKNFDKHNVVQKTIEKIV